ncbi:4-hydroxythreonine-4-phosphate dehydrogenase PdxA [Anabaena sp. FACHB-709]|uniref:4-hydroxythreonine-4-phosphate dehydrogenase n=3 Tax=Nostocaceae TaxID=1162 RepID=PDXA_NOSS1|nr:MULTISPECIES: 4-hydroxythreonine-4-phosphate dehydrogenase PdxA [Nostocaceae]P58711.1 RecName: Full=4-hydroxythreonine-4-phosphate dehydrogenase; AltName: Full=4-(phosphohydroxy)-L-threonine dehydrogenase [Nostoc sp. PCC 7120 = FACHB-418]BAY70361.1 pyridoxal phosphate biosynthetic protein PdxA [Trichormus variabilis NIES-23]HBW28627.1 4-hydroxythreonine-4-phosphate dehydrogenase PdxA [Nostoc sp. UBA8866]MBD2173532.1 4-hydroxythreonine-4-phosphate dehydrogenase PdxA [Anabaena cylindrica FACHB
MYQLNQNQTVNTPQKYRPRLALTVGDPGGIGAEVILKALADLEIGHNYDLTVVSNKNLLQETYKQLSSMENLLPLADPNLLKIIDVTVDRETARQINLGTGNAASGAASFAYMDYAIAQTLAGNFDGIVTGPIAKSAWKAAGYNYPGQTELLAQKSGVERFGMLFVARSPYTGWTLRALLATTHIPLRQVADTLTPQLLTQKLDLLVECLEKDFGITSGRIAIAGLNPHSGEQGQLGTEELDWLIPWLESERQKRPHFQLDGPIPPDTMWVKPGQAWYGNAIVQHPADAYLALYHDQGLIPVKLMAFDRAVNTSIGLPFVRTSPDHGTAFDIAGQGIADATSMKEAISLAAELVCQRLHLEK